MGKKSWEIVEVGVRHFQHIYKEPNYVKYCKNIKLASSFPRFVTKE
jgi:hypothetical protein